MSAGSSVSAATTMIATTIAAPTPMYVTNGMPATARPRIAMTTVPPAITTDWPAVAIARPIAVFDGEPSVQAGAMARDDEQRVVDADAEPDHRREHLGGRREA